MVQPLARHAVKNLGSLMNTLEVGDQAADLRRAMLGVGHRKPGKRTVERIHSSALLMKNKMATSMISALKKHAANENIDITNCDFSLVEFNSRVVGLGAALSRARDGHANADINHAEAIAIHAGVPEAVVWAAAQGFCVEVPFELAEKLAVAASQVLNTPAPLPVEMSHPTNTRTKPIGGKKLELGAAPHLCQETINLRSAILGWAS